MSRLRPGGPLAFGLVGAVGFLVDAAILTALTDHLGPYAARGFSFLAAVTVTWLLNRSYVFRVESNDAASKRREYTRYLLVQTGGVLVNLAVYLMLLRIFPVLQGIPVIALAAGSGLAMVFNYFGARRLVYAAPDRWSREARE